MEYSFALSSAAGGGTVLTSEQYLGDGLDWFDFDIDPSGTPGQGSAAVPIQRKAVPTPIRYGGMPLPRFWALGQKFNITGTPALVMSDGEMLSGYLPPDLLLKHLQEEQKH